VVNLNKGGNNMTFQELKNRCKKHGFVLGKVVGDIFNHDKTFIWDKYEANMYKNDVIAEFIPINTEEELNKYFPNWKRFIEEGF